MILKSISRRLNLLSRLSRLQINIRVTEEEKQRFNDLAVGYRSVSEYIKANTINKSKAKPNDLVEAINNLIEKYQHIRDINKSDILFSTKINNKISALKEVLRDIEAF